MLIYNKCALNFYVLLRDIGASHSNTLSRLAVLTNLYEKQIDISVQGKPKR